MPRSCAVWMTRRGAEFKRVEESEDFGRPEALVV